jgi:hypothetical protein
MNPQRNGAEAAGSHVSVPAGAKGAKYPQAAQLAPPTEWVIPYRVRAAALEIGESITAWQGLLRCGLFCLRHTITRSTFGISDLQRRNASGVQAARCSAVPSAKLDVEIVASASARTKPLPVRSMVSPLSWRPCDQWGLDRLPMAMRFLTQLQNLQQRGDAAGAAVVTLGAA